MDPLCTLLLLLSLFLNTAAGDIDINPIYDICDNGVPDIVVMLADETNCLIQGEHFFIIDLEAGNASSAIRLKDRWPKLPEYLDMAFTLSGVEWSEVDNMTIFVKGNHYYVYENMKHQSDASTEYWFDSKSRPKDVFYNQVMHQKSDAVIAFRSRELLRPTETAMVFDDPRRPNKVDLYRVTTALHPTVQSILTSSQAFYFVPSIDETFQLFFQSYDEGFYCFLPTWKSPCSPKKVTGMFNCPPELEAVRRKHFLGAITNRYRIRTSDFILCVLGSCLGVLVTMGCILMPMARKYLAVRAIQEDVQAVDDALIS